MSPISSATPCILDGRGGWQLIEPLWNFIARIETALRTHWAARALFYAAILAAIYLTWLFTDGEAVAFVYSEF